MKKILFVVVAWLAACVPASAHCVEYGNVWQSIEIHSDVRSAQCRGDWQNEPPSLAWSGATMHCMQNGFSEPSNDYNACWDRGGVIVIRSPGRHWDTHGRFIAKATDRFEWD